MSSPSETGSEEAAVQPSTGSQTGEGGETQVETGGQNTSGGSSTSPVFQKNKAIWKHFTLGDKPSSKKGKSPKDRKAICNLCKDKISRSGGSTSGMRNHLKRKHPDALTELLKDELQQVRQFDDAQSDLEEAFQNREAYAAKRKGKSLKKKKQLLNVLCFNCYKFEITLKLFTYTLTVSY